MLAVLEYEKTNTNTGHKEVEDQLGIRRYLAKAY